MIGALFKLGMEIIEVRVHDKDVYFRSSQYGAMFAPIEGLKLSKAGALKEFPELEGDPKWQEKAIVKFKEKINEFNNEDEKMNYIIEDLKKVGYQPMYKQKEGWRPERIR